MAAQQGYAKAQIKVGLLLSSGEGAAFAGSGDAASWFAKAAEQEEPLAQFYLAQCYLKEGRMTEEAYQLYLKAALHNLPQAQYEVGAAVQEGLCKVQEDKAAAYKWYIKAAKQGYAAAQDKVGCYLKEGEGKVRVDKQQAVEWFKKAAEQGLPTAQYNLAECYHNAEGVGKNLVEGYKWYRKAAEQGYASAQRMVGRYWENGWGGVKADQQQALEWYRRAAEQGDLLAKGYLARHSIFSWWKRL